LHGLLGYDDTHAEQGRRAEPLPVRQVLPKPTPLFVKFDTTLPTPAAPATA
jgi:hypothetical protein